MRSTSAVFFKKNSILESFYHALLKKPPGGRFVTIASPGRNAGALEIYNVDRRPVLCYIYFNIFIFSMMNTTACGMSDYAGL